MHKDFLIENFKTHSFFYTHKLPLSSSLEDKRRKSSNFLNDASIFIFILNLFEITTFTVKIYRSFSIENFKRHNFVSVQKLHPICSF